MCVCACGSGVEGWVFSLAAFRYTGTAMESAIELLPSKDNHGKREERASLVAQRLKRLPAMLETRVRFLSWEDPPGEGNGNLLQYSCLEHPMDGGAW